MRAPLALAALVLVAASPGWAQAPVARKIPPAVQAALEKAQGGDVADLVQLAKGGDVEVQNLLGDLYFRGSPTVKRDPKEARRWYAMAAAQKHPQASRRLGEMYANGDGGKKNTKKALELWRAAEAAGDPFANILVADQLFSDLTGGRKPEPGRYGFRGGVPSADLDVIESWYQAAADRDPRPEVKERAKRALGVVATLKTAAGAVSVQTR
jgi:TPR repeat protein